VARLGKVGLGSVRRGDAGQGRDTYLDGERLLETKGVLVKAGFGAARPGKAARRVAGQGRARILTLIRVPLKEGLSYQGAAGPG